MEVQPAVRQALRRREDGAHATARPGSDGDALLFGNDHHFVPHCGVQRRDAGGADADDGRRLPRPQHSRPAAPRWRGRHRDPSLHDRPTRQGVRRGRKRARAVDAAVPGPTQGPGPGGNYRVEEDEPQVRQTRERLRMGLRSSDRAVAAEKRGAIRVDQRAAAGVAPSQPPPGTTFECRCEGQTQAPGTPDGDQAGGVRGVPRGTVLRVTRQARDQVLLQVVRKPRAQARERRSRGKLANQTETRAQGVQEPRQTPRNPPRKAPRKAP
mmetsp:Transcript_13961/g.32250  ORF Transcript_13961/g.32250 Transcript_13961/m.32250 type:complete len:268 (+) Transcript_13961:1441-2244(+)